MNDDILNAARVLVASPPSCQRCYNTGESYGLGGKGETCPDCHGSGDLKDEAKEYAAALIEARAEVERLRNAVENAEADDWTKDHNNAQTCPTWMDAQPGCRCSVGTLLHVVAEVRAEAAHLQEHIAHVTAIGQKCYDALALRVCNYARERQDNELIRLVRGER